MQIVSKYKYAFQIPYKIIFLYEMKNDTIGNYFYLILKNDDLFTLSLDNDLLNF